MGEPGSGLAPGEEGNRLLDPALARPGRFRRRDCAAGHDPSDGYLSPVFANLAGFPPGFRDMAVR
jgi:hypothetical protein